MLIHCHLTTSITITITMGPQKRAAPEDSAQIHMGYQKVIGGCARGNATGEMQQRRCNRGGVAEEGGRRKEGMKEGRMDRQWQIRIPISRYIFKHINTISNN